MTGGDGTHEEDRPGRAERPEQPGPPERPEQPGPPEGPDRLERSERLDRLDEVLRVLGAAGQDLGPQTVLDVLWLARCLSLDPARLPLEAARRPPRSAPAQDGEPPAEPPEATERAELPLPDEDLPDLALPELHAAPVPPAPASREPAERPESARADEPEPGMPVRVPEEKALVQELLVGRSLRPLRLKRPSRWRFELDEAATAAALAETWLPDVVMQPVRERWLNLALVVEDGVSMLLWQRLAIELQATLQRLGAFRSLRVHGLDTASSSGPVLRGRPFGAGGAPLPPSLLADPSGQTLVLVVSDGMGAAWRQGRMHAVLRRWAKCGPVAVLHTLPPALWDGSGIQADHWQVTTRRPGAPNTHWQVTDPVLPAELAGFSGVPVPVLEPTAEALRDWARLLTSPGATVGLPLLSPPRRRALIAPPREARGIQHFRDAASPEAYRLAAHLAAVSPVSVPVMRLVQNAVPWPARTAHLAEVFLGGLIRPVPAPVSAAWPLPPRHRVFQFTPEAERALLDAVPSAELLATGRRIGRRIEQLAGRSPDFPAWLAHPDGADTVPSAFRSFTAVERRLLARFGVSMESLPAPSRPSESRPRSAQHWDPLTPQDPQQLGPYRLSGRRLGERSIVYRGHDTRGTEVAIRMMRPEMPSYVTQLLGVEAEALRRMNGRYAPTLLATRLRDVPPWIAMQMVTTPGPGGDALPVLSDLLQVSAGSGRAPFDILTSLTLGWHLASALSICHTNGVVPAALTADSVVVLQRSVLLTGLADCALDGEYAGTGPVPEPADSVQALGELLRQISSKSYSGARTLSERMELWQGDSWQALRTMVTRCLSPDPAERPSAPEVAELLAGYVALARGGPQPGVRPSGASGPPSERPRLEARPRGAPPALSELRIGRRPVWSATRSVERAEFHRLLAGLRRPLGQSLRVTVAGVSPGSGRATTAMTLGTLLSVVRGEPVLVLDGAPTAGDLHAHLTQRSPATLGDLASLAPDASYEEIRRLTTRTRDGLEVVAHSAAFKAPSPSHFDEYRRVLSMASRHYPVVLTDWAEGRIGARAEAVLEQTDRLVLCCTNALHATEAVERQLAELRRTGWESLADRAVIVATALGGSGAVLSAQGVRAHLPTAGPLVFVPFDLHLSGIAERNLGRLRPRTAEAYANLADRLFAGAVGISGSG
ncbi:SAV_2336 N-terminal domain-related protein [Streptomyces sp. NPDC058746]|uniref:SAV_2336 N-terminal domain-related protein n=1 Tax=Streptomyces sp. NPDC058746 TaxID=3346622 RepID=UPI0036B39DFF